MNLPVDLLHWLAAFAPIAMLLFLMIKRKWGIRAAAPVGLAVTVLTGLCFYKADLELILLQCGKGIWNALPILLIIATAILLYQVGEEAGAFPVIRNGMRKFLPNELLLVLAMGWILESFLQGITGFGVPVAVGAPLLMGIGVRPVWAVILPMLGQSWGNTYGTLAVSWDMLAASAGTTWLFSSRATSPSYTLPMRIWSSADPDWLRMSRLVGASVSPMVTVSRRPACCVAGRLTIAMMPMTTATTATAATASHAHGRRCGVLTRALSEASVLASLVGDAGVVGDEVAPVRPCAPGCSAMTILMRCVW